MSFKRYCLVLALASTVIAVGAGAAWPAGRTAVGRKPVARPSRSERANRTAVFDSDRRIDVNNLNMFVTNLGSWANDFANQNNSGLFFPKGTLKTAVYESGLWLGALVSGEGNPRSPRTVVAEYSQEYGPGPMVAGESDDHDLPIHKVYKVVRFSGDPADTGHVEYPDAAVAADRTLDQVIHHSWSEYLTGAAPYGAPTRTYRLPDPSTPDETDSIDVLGPDVSGDQMLWSVYNDADPDLHSNEAGSSEPLGVEIQQSTFGFNRQGALGNTVFLKFTIINKGANTLDSMFVSLWSDPDLGQASDDLVGSDVPRSMGFVYNATNNDQVYGIAPPAVGYDFFLGPKGAGGTVLPLTSFNKYINGTDPASNTETYRYMRGLVGQTGDPVIDPTTGDTTTFFHPGDPVTGTGWLDTNPADRRFLMSSGPFTMAPGDTQVVVGAMVIGQGGDRLSSITALRFYDDQAQDAFDANFNLCPPPPQPKVTVSQAHGEITLNWDSASRLSYQGCPGYTFEGYNVYQGASVAGPWKRLATFDEVNGITVVRDTVFDTNTGQLITDFPVAFGGDNGVRFSYTTSQDAIRGGALHDATEYYFAVTAYGVNELAKEAVLENAQQPVKVTPQRLASGTSPTSGSANCPSYVQASTAVPITTDQVELNAVQPDAITGDTYAITYAPLPQDSVVGGETVSIGWNLVDLTTGQTLLANQVNKSGDPDYRVVDGLQVKVIGTYSVQNAFNTANYFGAACPVFADPNPPIAGLNGAGLGSFGDGAGPALFFQGAGFDPDAQPDSFTTVELRFSSTTRQKAYRFLRKETSTGSAPANVGRSYSYAGFHTVPFTVWDTRNNLQLDAAFVERAVTDDDGVMTGAQPATHDSTWGPDASGTGGREYLFIAKSVYTDTPKPAFMEDAAPQDPALPWEYAMWAVRTSASATFADGDVFRYVWGFIPGTPNDTIRFSTTPLQHNNVALIKSNINSIRAVPNPYYNRSRYELTAFNRVIRFTNMPERATVRIFNLAGDLIRTLHKDDASTSLLQWDLLTENRLPVASGIYIYHVEAPGASTTGRLVVFMEKERLNAF